MRGRVRCAPLKCDLPLDGCEPVTAPGKCCPVSYDCSKSRVSVTKTISSASSHNTKASLSGSTKGENSVRSISFDARSNREISSKESKVKIETAHHQQHEHVSLTTQLPLLEESPTTLLTGTADNIAITLNTKLDLGGTLDLLKTKNNSVIPEKNKILPMIEAIINKTRQKDQDYDYDYNEPSLPPSLPNLRIIPFVAEDAVTPEKRVVSSNVQKLPESNMAISKESQDKIDNFYLFSPPVETEGGFVPREPAVDSPFHQQKYDTPITATQPKVPPTKVRPPEVTIRTVIPEAVTPDPLLGNGGSTPCTSGGRRYRHGELLTGMGACRMCFCFDGGIVCQEPSCGAVPPGCSRAPAREPDQCCGSIVCGDEHRESPLLFADVPEAEPQRGHARVPERPPVIEPVPDLVPAFTSTLITKRPPTTTTTTTTTTTAAPSTTEAAAASPSTTTSSTTAPPSTTKSHRNKTSTTTTASPTKDKTALRTKTTTAKPARTTTTQRPSSTTAKTSTTTKASTTAKPLTTPAAVPSTSKPTTSTPPASPTGKPLTSTSTTANPLSSTTSSTTVKPPPPPPPPSSTTTTRRPPPLRKERPTTPASFFDVLWGTEDESENEAQDKVDQDVEYHDFVSTNQHEQEQPPPPPRPAPAADEEDSFSFDKFLELFIQPDPPVTTPAAPSASPATVTTPTTTAPRTPAPSTTSPRSTTTAKVKVTPTTTPTTPRTTTTVGTASAPPMSSSTRAPPKKDAKPTATATPAANMTSPSSTAPTPPAPKPTEGPVKRTTTAPKPKPPAPSKGTTTARPPTSTRKPGTTTITRRPTTTPKATTRKPSTTTTTAAAPTTSTTTTTPSTTSTPAPPTSPPPTTTTTTTTVLPIATMRPSLLFGTNKHRPTFNADRDRDSYPPPPPATRRPPTTPPPSTSPALSGLSGLLKLAGCNIYGRMYRVGRIIQELSGPCLECRCTDVGVQCQPKC
ncbi:hypothetical protein ONE63_004389 [Megalurothrips usitatus]|uniref:VWFC domain-containing protein n=1 Tax=Megalurothrips usitatus TaxID=439358 RepID=A0AAV7X620_9NEOP|nr:hypothetical protein ONE63_004389 [Megalurothrips usitatus]